MSDEAKDKAAFEAIFGAGSAGATAKVEMPPATEKAKEPPTIEDALEADEPTQDDGDDYVAKYGTLRGVGVPEELLGLAKGREDVFDKWVAKDKVRQARITRTYEERDALVAENEQLRRQVEQLGVSGAQGQVARVRAILREKIGDKADELDDDEVKALGDVIPAETPQTRAQDPRQAALDREITSNKERLGERFPEIRQADVWADVKAEAFSAARDPYWLRVAGGDHAKAFQNVFDEAVRRVLGDDAGPAPVEQEEKKPRANGKKPVHSAASGGSRNVPAKKELSQKERDEIAFNSLQRDWDAGQPGDIAAARDMQGISPLPRNHRVKAEYHSRRPGKRTA